MTLPRLCWGCGVALSALAAAGLWALLPGSGRAQAPAAAATVEVCTPTGIKRMALPDAGAQPAIPP